MPLRVGEAVGAATLLLGRQALDPRDRLVEDPVLDGLPVVVHALELRGEVAGDGRIVGEQELERGLGAAEAASGVDARGEAEADGALVDGGRVDVGGAHQGLQAGARRAGEAAQTGDGEAAVLIHQRHDVGDRGERDQIEVALQALAAGGQQGLCELVDDARAAERRVRVAGRLCRDDRAGGQHLGGTVVVGDDHLHAELEGAVDLGGCRDAAVNGKDQADALGVQLLDGRNAQAVAVGEAAGQAPGDVAADLAQHEHRERGGADAVDVVVAVDADARSGGRGGAQLLDRDGHVAEQEGVVAGQGALDEGARGGGLAVAAAHQHGGRHLIDAERSDELLHMRGIGRADRPGALAHRGLRYGPDRMDRTGAAAPRGERAGRSRSAWRACGRAGGRRGHRCRASAAARPSPRRR